MAKKEKAPAPPEETNKSEARAPEAPAAAPRADNKKLIIIALAAMLVGVGISFAAFKLLSPAPSAPTAAPEEAANHEADGEKPIEAPHRAASSGEEAAPPSGGHGGGGEGEAPVVTGPQNIELKPFIANLSDGKKILKLVMSVEAENQALADEINAKIPQFRDIILMLLSSLAYDDIATLDGKIRLRNQMLNRINTQLTSGKVKNIYFSEFVVQ